MAVKPKQVTIVMLPAIGNVHLDINGMKWDRDVKPGEDRDPALIYIPDIDTDQRDLALAFFVDAWGELELALASLLRTAMGTNSDVTSAVLQSLQSTANTLDLLLQLNRLTFTEIENNEVENLCDRVRKYNTKRNRIIHGAWFMNLMIRNVHGGINIEDAFWTRYYDPGDSLIREAISNPQSPKHQKERAAYIYTVDRLRTTAEEVVKLSEDISAVSIPIYARLRP